MLPLYQSHIQHRLLNNFARALRRDPSGQRQRPHRLDAQSGRCREIHAARSRREVDQQRALVRNPEILILDDSSSALDYATDAALRKAIKQLKTTVFIVSQRTSSVRDADKIVVLDDGAAVGVGTHETLMQDCEVYREIYRSQYGEEGGAV